MGKLARPKPCYLWTTAEVQKWLKRHCSEYFQNYSQLFIIHDISGKALVHMSEEALIRLGINNPNHREAVWREILKLRLKADIQEMKEIEMSTKYPDHINFFK
ncbi:Protein aveugle [Armadillidium nasatum]|uniref:Protein aveugle n=1 Tax=Armadillidium nasatum TaxID=96803 RepID=A0A5N5STV9_9CRUS|nr:Protein aveugle [Armadillidium nasatum]